MGTVKVGQKMRMPKGQSKMDNPEKQQQDTRWRQTKQSHNIICVGHHRMQISTNNVNDTWALLQTTGGNNEPNSVCVCTV